MRQADGRCPHEVFPPLLFACPRLCYPLRWFVVINGTTGKPNPARPSPSSRQPSRARKTSAASRRMRTGKFVFTQDVKAGVGRRPAAPAGRLRWRSVQQDHSSRLSRHQASIFRFSSLQKSRRSENRTALLRAGAVAERHPAGQRRLHLQERRQDDLERSGPRHSAV